MASSRGRDRLKERQTSGRCFVFGSSTPRDLSHMNKIPSKLRSYDAKVRVVREGPVLKDYMEKARSLTREGSEEVRHWAFGSSTPRDLAHMTQITANQRVYDAKSPKKSTTSPEFTTPIHKRSTTAPQPVQRPITSKEKKVKVKDDDVSSEPDIVQDREDYLAELKRKKSQTQKKEAAKKIENKKLAINDSSNKGRVSVGKTHHDETTFTHAPVLAEEVQHKERVPHNFHEDESSTAQQDLVRGWDDQIIVSELNEATPDKEIIIGEAGQEKDEKLTAGPIAKELLQKVEHIATDLKKDMKNSIEEVKDAMSKSNQKFRNNVDNVPKATEEAQTPMDNKKTVIIDSIKKDVIHTENKTSTPIDLQPSGSITDKKANIKEGESRDTDKRFSEVKMPTDSIIHATLSTKNNVSDEITNAISRAKLS
uniref:Doublecortin domain-containing protein n=1 Tax=Heterorhabditis bacteriophora TaxID=37862 RepID=A0A1I7XB36_HETBA